MSNNEIIENEEQTEYIEQDTNKAPSGVSLFADKLKNWLNGQNKVMVYGVTAVVVAALGFIAYKYMYQMPREKEGLAAIYKTQELFDNDSFRLVAKDAPKLAEKYSGTKAGELAEYMSGVSFLYTGDYKKAIEFLEGVDFDDQVMQYQVVGLLGDAYIENKDVDAGLKQYLKAAKGADNEFSIVWWSRKAARVYEKKNDWESALEIYEKIKKDYPENEFSIEADKYIFRAKAKIGEY
jgi:tetratricopeptide (TPR) repeat protein